MESGGGAGPDHGEAGGQLPKGGGAVEVRPEGREMVQRRGIVSELTGAVSEAEGAVVVRGDGGGEGLGSGGQGGCEGGGEAEEGRRGERGEELGVEAVEEGLVEEDLGGEGPRGGGAADGGEDSGEEGGIAVHEGWGWRGIKREGEGKGACLQGEEFAPYV